jgi:hypothetical protein
MRPPFKVELYDTNGNAQIFGMTTSLEAARRVYDEAVAKLRTGEVIRVRDSAGALIFSSDSNS